jgi:hypothetical protein
MSDIKKKIEIPSDSDGFITLECPYCNSRFKLTVDFLEERPIIDLFCPCCGLKHDPSNFLLMREDVSEQVEIVAHNIVADLLNQFSANLQRNINSKSVKFKAGSPIPSEAEKSLWEREEMEDLTLKCCDVRVKVKYPQHDCIYCPECGVN